MGFCAQGGIIIAVLIFFADFFCAPNEVSCVSGIQDEVDCAVEIFDTFQE